MYICTFYDTDEIVRYYKIESLLSKNKFKDVSIMLVISFCREEHGNAWPSIRLFMFSAFFLVMLLPNKFIFGMWPSYEEL